MTKKPKLNKAWGNCLKRHLSDRGISLRAAALKTGGSPVHTTWMGWCNGKPPSDIDEATEALEVVIGREAAAECLAILNEPIPREWNLPQYVVEFYEDTKDLSPDEKAEMWQEVQDIVKRFTKKQGRREES